MIIFAGKLQIRPKYIRHYIYIYWHVHLPAYLDLWWLWQFLINRKNQQLFLWIIILKSLSKTVLIQDGQMTMSVHQIKCLLGSEYFVGIIVWYHIEAETKWSLFCWNILKFIFFGVRILIPILLKFAPTWSNYQHPWPSLVQIMARRRMNTPLPETMKVSWSDAYMSHSTSMG